MANKVVIDEKTCACPVYGYQWDCSFGLTELIFNEDERVLACPECGEPIEDGDDYD